MALLLALLGLIIWIIYWSFLIMGMKLASREEANTNQIGEIGGAFTLPPVTVLKPLCGWDGGLGTNLESFFQLDYSCFEIIFCLSSKDDQILRLIKALREKYPQINAKVTISQGGKGKNPKVSNLEKAFENAEFDVILISDSNIRVEPDYLKCMTSLLKDKVGVVTSPVEGIGEKSAGGYLESLYLGTHLKRWIYLSHRLGKPIVLGKSMLFRKSILKQVGGIALLQDLIAEDYATSKLMQAAGFRVAVLKTPVQQYLGEFNFKAFWARHVRWGRIRKSCEWKAFLLEPLSNALISGLIGAFTWHCFFREPGILPFIVLHLVFSALVEIKVLERSYRFFDLLFFLGVWVTLEITALPLWIQSLCGRTVLWRGNRLRLYSGGRLKEN